MDAQEALARRIDELCAEVERLHAEQAHWELGNCPGCLNVADLQEALEQNAKLRDENAKLLRMLRALALCADDNADCDKCVMNEAVCSSVRQTFCNRMADELQAVGIEVD